MSEKSGENTKTIRVSQLGLAAYIKMKGHTLVTVDGRNFVFESERPVSDWRVEYSNSECAKHDAILCELREHVRGSP